MVDKVLQGEAVAGDEHGREHCQRLVDGEVTHLVGEGHFMLIKRGGNLICDFFFHGLILMINCFF